MAKTKRYSSKEIIGLLEADGWVLVKVEGSHHKYKHPFKKGAVVVPHPKKDLAIGTAKNILREAQLKD
jgi:predicted RNA binding protein YcfA (HicA-like mRNA interferase family)